MACATPAATARSWTRSSPRPVVATSTACSPCSISDVVLRADDATVQAGAEREVRGAAAVAATFSGRARVARPALIDGAPGAVWSQGGRPRVVFDFTFDGDTIVAIDLLADPATLEALDLAFER